MANQASRDSTELPFVRNNGAGGYRTSEIWRQPLCDIWNIRPKVSVRLDAAFIMAQCTRACIGKPSVCTDRFRSFVAFFESRTRAEAAAGAFSRPGYIQRRESKSMNGIFMSGLKISRVAGRGVRRRSYYVIFFRLRHLSLSTTGRMPARTPRQWESASYRCRRRRRRAARPKTVSVAVFPLIIFERRNRARERKRREINTELDAGEK